jgi:hypothetical protein
MRANIFLIMAFFLVMQGVMAETVKLSVPLTNHNPIEVSGVVHWMVTDGLTWKTYDYFSSCEEYRQSPITKIAPGKTAVVSCTSSLLPSIETGPHSVAIYFAKSRTNTTYGSSQARLDCNKLGGTLRLSKCGASEAEVDKASALLGLEKCCLDAATTNAYCVGDYCGTDCVQTPNGCKMAKLTLIFLPINWKGTEVEYNAKIDYYMESVRNDFPLKDCKEMIRTIIVPLKYGLEFDFLSLDACFQGRSTKSFGLIEDRLASLGYGDRYNFGVGIYGDKISGSCGIANPDSDIIILPSCPLSSKENKYSLSHELGHKAGLNDEYFDAVRCKYGYFSLESNRLLKELGGDEPLNRDTEGFCAEGNMCLKRVEKETSQCLDFDRYCCDVDGSGNLVSCKNWDKGSTTCKGNKRGENLNERCIMSFVEGDASTNEAWYQPKTGFCRECMKHLETVSWLNCDDEE